MGGWGHTWYIPGTGQAYKYAIAIAFGIAVSQAFKSYPTKSTSLREHGVPPLQAGTNVVEEVDVISVGAGIGGLSCGALTSEYAFKIHCFEAHDRPGGVAHSFFRCSTASKTLQFRFDSGASLITGLSSKSTNPLRQV